MSFLASAFSGASNNYQPQGTAQANTNINNASTGLNSLAAQLQAQAQGNGVNLANQQLQNTTAQNVGTQAALMAGQRGASNNVGLMSRQIANQGANIQQQAVGQAASNRLAEQLQSQQQLGNVLGTEGNLGTNVLNQNNQIGSQQAGQNAKMNQGLIGGVANIGSNLISKVFADGGPVQAQPKGAFDSLSEGSNFGFNFVNGNKPAAPLVSNINSAPQNQQFKPMQTNTMMAARGGEAHLPFTPHDYRAGGDVIASSPKEKAVKPGNSYANDKIPAMLSEGEVVIPREVMSQPNAPHAAANFVAQVMSGKHRGKK